MAGPVAMLPAQRGISASTPRHAAISLPSCIPRPCCAINALQQRLAFAAPRCLSASGPPLAGASPRAHVSASASPAHARSVRCQSLAIEGGASPGGRGMQYWVDKAVLGALFGGWYLANIVFNIYNKQTLSAFPQPLTLTTLQFGIGSVLALSMWATGIVKRPTLTGSTVKAVALLGLVHTLGNLLTNVSLGAVAVSFTHTIKAMEPFFSVILSALFLNDVPSLAVVSTLLPIVGGVALASVSEASFNWLGFLTAMGSNLTFQSRNVLSKKLMLKKDGLDNISMFSLITIASFIMLLPVSLAVEGWKLSPAGLTAMGVANPNLVMQQAFTAALCFHTYQQVSYMILSRVSPVTHAIGNCVKRVVVICAAVIFFSNPVSMQNAAGTAIALGGVFAYGQVKRAQRKAKEQECAVAWDKDEECVVPDQTIEEPSG